MNIGEFKHRITFQIYDENALDSSGFPINEDERFVDYKTAYSKIITLKGKEYHAAQAIQSENEVRFVVRYSKQIAENINHLSRIRHKTKYYDIKSIVNDDELNKTFTIVAKVRL